MARITIESIQDTLNPEGWSVLSTEYANLESLLVFECPEGHMVTSSWKKLRNNLSCPICENNVYKNIETTTVKQKAKGVNRILALDQATHITGYALFDNEKLVTYGTFKTTTTDEIARDKQIAEWLVSAIHNWKPDYIGLEGIQLQQNLYGGETVGVTTFETLARLQGILMLTCYQNKIEYKICPSTIWRKFCGVKGKHRTDKKRSAQNIIKKEYDVTVSNDEADAILIGKYVANFYDNNKNIEVWD